MSDAWEADEILPGLYLGSATASSNRAALKAVGISHIMCVAKGLSLHYPEEFTYKHIELMDDEEEDIAAHIDSGLTFIEEGRKSGGILIHCAAGVSRSASFTVAYVMKQMNLSFDHALDFVMRRRWISPNQGFVKQLRQYETTLGIESKPVMMYCN